MKILKYISMITLALFFIKCSNIENKELFGTYKARNNINTIDTLQIFKGGKYQRGLYRKKDKSVVYKHSGTWKYKNGMITFNDFYMDYDNEYNHKKRRFAESSMNCAFEVERVFLNIYIGKKMSRAYLYVKL